MTKFYRIVGAVAFAALIAGGLTIVATGFSSDVSAKSPIHSGKGDRLDIRPAAMPCSEQTWPYIDHRCLNARLAEEASSPRIVTTDRL